MLHEIKKLHICINKIEETTILCHNSAIAIRSDRGLHILDIPYNLRRYDKNLEYLETLITASKYSPVTELFESNFVKNGVKNSDFIQMILDPTLWPHDHQLLNEMTNIASFKWSPIGFLGNMDSAMAILTNVGCVELFGPNRLKWTSVLNLSCLVKENLNRLSLTKTPNVIPRNSKELQEAAHTLATIAICWPDKVNLDGSCFLVTAQKCGLILFWLLKFQGLGISGEVVGHITTDKFEINDVTWVPLSDNKFLIVISNIVGKVYIQECVIDNNSIITLSKHELWTYNDRMIAKHFNYIVDDENIILLYSKHRHFVIQMLDKYFKIKSQEVTNINDYKVTDIKKQNNLFYLATINNKIYKIDIQYSSLTLKVQASLVQIKESYPTCELHALGFSTNGVLCTLALIDRKILWRKEPFKIDLIFLKNSNEESEISFLLSNKTKKLTNYWDYIEMLRYTITKTRMLPDLDYNQLFEEGDEDIYKLKVYYILLILYNNLGKLCKNSTMYLPETSLKVIEEKIHAIYASNLIRRISKKYKKTCDLINLESETIYNAKTYLEYYCNKYKKDLSTMLDPDILKIINKDYEYTCQCCDKQLINLSCEVSHVNMLCSLTFTPIESNDYLVCKSCGALALSELRVDRPMCVFCDLYLCESVTT